MSTGKHKMKHWQMVTLILIVYDVIAIAAAYFLALWLRFDCRFAEIPQEYFHAYVCFILIYCAICVCIFWFMRLYRTVWRFASYNELIRVFIATVITGLVHVVLIDTLFHRMPVSYFLFGIVIQFIFILGVRFSYRFILLLRGQRGESAEETYHKNILLIGAGNAGQMILRDVKSNPDIHGKVVAIIDDNPNKWGRYIDGISVVGGRDEIMKTCQDRHIDQIYVALPGASASNRRDILNICKDTGCELKNLPDMYALMNDSVSVRNMKDVAIEDLLGREPIRANMEEIFHYIQGKRILVTGGGGSIGSELARQIAAHQPEQLILFDVYENNVYDIQLELRKKYPELNLVVLIGSVRDSRRIFQVFETYKPQIVYHAAAHKHVPLMEDSPCESIKNNAIGTYKTAFAAMAHGTERFVLISTDKAVNPTNIMGASKRLCEMVIQAMDSKVKAGEAESVPQLFTHWSGELVKNPAVKYQLEHAKTEFVAVRFGNVLGSNGSVIPIFKRQIASGGPVTVTHPDIIRYFMTIPEAVSLVLQAGTYAKGGEIFVLDMGEPMKIDTLARNLIKLSGYKPDVDIKVEYTGLRPGEKLYEEKLMAEEGLKKTKNDLIHIGQPIPFDTEVFLGQLEGLMEAAYKNKANIRELVMDVVKTYHPA